MENTRTRMVETGLGLFRRQGYAETSWRTLAKEGQVPLGSIQHFFPGGKEQLATEALGLFTRQFQAFFDELCEGHRRPGDRIRAWFEATADEMEAGGFGTGCPLAGIALNAMPAQEGLSGLCHTTMAQWKDYIASKLVSDTLDPASAGRWAEQALVGLEGALVLSRVQRSSAPLRSTGAWLGALVNGV